MKCYDLRKDGDIERIRVELDLKNRVNDLLRNEYHVKPLFHAINGAHLWGLQSSDSDIDIHGLYLKPTMGVLDLRPGEDYIQMKIQPRNADEPIIELQMFEIQKFFNLLMRNNGNVITMIKSPFVTFAGEHKLGPRFWPSLMNPFMTRELKHYFKGYAHSQKKRALSSRGGKALIYTYREMFSGMYLMHYGKFEFSFQKLLETAQNNHWYSGGWGNVGLLFKYYKPETGNVTGNVDTNDWNEFFAEWDKLVEIMESITINSPLPENYDGYPLLNQVLQAYRYEGLMI